MKKSESKYFHTAVKMNMALISLLEKKEFAYITVSEICRAAGVNRSTFYLHYETVGDLLEETTRYLLDDFVSYFSVDPQATVARFRDCDLAQLNFITDEYLHPYLRYIRDHRRVFAVALSNIGHFGFEGVYKRLYTHIFEPILARFHYPLEHRPYVMLFYMNGVNAVVSEWLKNDCRLTIEEVSAIIHECIFGRDPALLAAMDASQNKE